MGRWLLGIDDPASTKEGEQQARKARGPARRSTPSTPPRRSKDARAARSLPDRDLGTTARRPRARRRARRAGKRRGGCSLTSLKIRAGVENPAHESIVEHEVRQHHARGLHDRPLGRRPTRRPATRSRSSGSCPRHPTGRLTIIAHPAGQGGARRRAAGEPSELAQALAGARPGRRRLRSAVRRRIARSARTRCRTGPTRVHFETYNPVAAADQMQDLATVARLGQEPARRRAR